MSATYRRLDQHELRLVALLPGSSGTMIQCELVYTSFHRHPPYEAVSYTWGDPTLTEDIILDGRPLTITAGLARALYYFRQTKDKCLLWIDAICINQRDDEEKSQQVRLMFDIYRNAKAVRAWIGRSLGEESEDRFQSLQDRLNFEFDDFGIQNYQNPLAVGSIIQQDPWNVWSLIVMLGKLADFSMIECSSISESFKSSTAAWKDLCLLLLRPYWRRVWIQQEILDVSKVVVHCGSVALSLSMLHDSCTAVFSYIDAATQTGTKIPTAALFVRECYLQIRNLKYLFESGDKNFIYVTNLLGSQMFRQTSDPRDKIYGIVGLVSSWRSTFSINYRLSAYEVYISLFKFITQKYGSLNMLVSQVRLNTPRLAGLPSWCPDWSQTMLPSYVVGENDEVPELFDESTPLEGNQIGRPVYSFAGIDHILVVKGVVLDVCKSVTACFDGTASILSPVQSELLDDALRLARRSVHGTDWPHWRSLESSRQIDDHENQLKSLDRDEPTKPQGLFQFDFEPDAHWFDGEEAILRTLVANNKKYSFNEDVLARFRSQTLSPANGYGAENVSSQSVHATSLSEASNSSFQDKDQASGSIRLEDIITSHTFHQPTRHRRFFVSSKNYMGLAPAGSQVDDLVCIIFGCRLPVMLRPINNHFIFVGETYLHGWMNGEVASLLESGQLQPQDFELR